MQVWEIERLYYFPILVFSSRTDKVEIGKDRIKRLVSNIRKREMDEIPTELSEVSLKMALSIINRIYI